MAGDNLLTASSMAPKILAAQQLSGSGADVILLVAAGESVILKGGTICNISNDPDLAPAPVVAHVSISMLPAGAAPDGTHRLLSLAVLAAGNALSLLDYIQNFDLGPGDQFRAECDVPGAVDIVISGVLSS